MPTTPTSESISGADRNDDSGSAGRQTVLYRPFSRAEADPGRIRLVLSVGALVAITLLSFWAAINAEWVETFGHWGYLGVTLISFFSSATVILPAPGLAVVFSMGGALNPVLLGVLAGIGSGLGELSGYVAGASGRALVSNERVSPYLRRFASDYTVVALFVLATIPFPVFDFVGILAGAMRMRVSLFLGVVIGGKIVKHVLVALAGAGVLPMFRLFFGL